MVRNKGEWDPDVAKKTLIIVSHEASRTGAPILALNICKELIEFKNIVVISLKDGELIEDFGANSTLVLVPKKDQYQS